jgi:hypothetical protein
MKLTSLTKPRKLVASVAIAIAFGATLQAGESKAQVLSTSCNPGIVGDCANGLTIGDKFASAFSFTGDYVPTEEDELKFSYDPISKVYQLQLDANPDRAIPLGTTTNSNFFYTLAITPDGIAAGNTFLSAQSNITGSNLADPPEDSGSFSTTITSPALIGSATADSTTNPSPIRFFNPGLTTSRFDQAFTSTGVASISSLGISFTQRTTPPSEVPGPLPLLGAAAAFGFSRKMRHRIRQTA